MNDGWFRSRAVLAVVAAFAALGASACIESIPPQRYGITSVEFRGVEEMDEQAVAACLATRERSSFSFNLGRTAEPECGVPPFDAGRVTISLWRWPWTDWPLYDQSVFERDLARVERWYRARGFYQARVRSAQVDPPVAREIDRIRTPQAAPCADAREGDEGCEVSVIIDVEEGEPVLVRSVRIEYQHRENEGPIEIPGSLRAEIEDAITLTAGERFDEHSYDESKERIERALREGSFAKVEVRGRVTIDPVNHHADIEYRVLPGPSCVFGRVTVEGNGDLPARPIAGAAYIERGQRYSQSAVEDAQRAIYALGAFSSVEVEPQVPESGNVVDLVVRVVPGRLTRFGVGLGVQSGLTQSGPTNEETQSVNEWDVHALVFYENRNFLGGLRRFRVEERPRLIFPGPFPSTTSDDQDAAPEETGLLSQLGNRITLEFRQPAFIERRTNLIFQSTWDYGPDPLRRDFRRHDVDAWIGPQRTFFSDRLLLTAAVHGNYFRVVSRDQEFDPELPADYELLFLEQYARLDLRDDPRTPRRGAYFSLGIHEAGFFLPSSWDYLRVTPEARGYVPLPFLGIVVAARVGIGVLHIFSTRFDEVGQQGIESDAHLGPERYRLRGGGASSNRGFVAGDLGDGIIGGIRRWEASVELRLPITVNFGLVLFVDSGDVSREPRFRLDHPQVSTGFGLRYLTLVGPVRLDFGFRVPPLQYLGEDDRRRDPLHREPALADLGFIDPFKGAVHLTIGESF